MKTTITTVILKTVTMGIILAGLVSCGKNSNGIDTKAAIDSATHNIDTAAISKLEQQARVQSNIEKNLNIEISEQSAHKTLEILRKTSLTSLSNDADGITFIKTDDALLMYKLHIRLGDNRLSVLKINYTKIGEKLEFTDYSTSFITLLSNEATLQYELSVENNNSVLELSNIPDQSYRIFSISEFSHWRIL